MTAPPSSKISSFCSQLLATAEAFIHTEIQRRSVPLDAGFFMHWQPLGSTTGSNLFDANAPRRKNLQKIFKAYRSILVEIFDTR